MRPVNPSEAVILGVLMLGSALDAPAADEANEACETREGAKMRDADGTPTAGETPGAGAQPSNAASWVGSAQPHARVGLLFAQNAATTRSLAAEAVAGVRWRGQFPFMLGASYRAGWRSAGGDVVGVTTSVHRLSVDVGYATGKGRLRVLGALGVHPWLRTAQLRSQHHRGKVYTTRGFGMGLDLEVHTPIAGRWSASVAVGSYVQQDAIDYSLGCGLLWN